MLTISTIHHQGYTFRVQQNLFKRLVVTMLKDRSILTVHQLGEGANLADAMNLSRYLAWIA